MPTILIEKGYRLFFYADEGVEPIHIHVEYQGATAKFWINPCELAHNRGLNGSQLSRAAKIVQKHEVFIGEKWHEFFSRKI